ncbi:hypothetical protein M413DRAFT_28396 [Hebeloma cylindrosporum]|uniref:Nudix hydrolase domain-containing protein n=1 Tax=Hebeloma cylindrosporum TaxID=76867 RepID=A0A0C3C8Q5_HEBCY|nr:hypothetical protein M413DRAFT_28396 [Hebeloma cylindrosporum h7]
MKSTSPIPQETLSLLSEKSRCCIENLLANIAALDHADLSHFRHLQSRLAAVLVLLYEENGELRVLLTTRSKDLRTHAGQTALPGGKKDASDANLTFTAYREAHEEVALPLDCPSIYTLGPLDPFISLHKLLVTPIIAFLSNPEIISSLRASQGEVSHIFSHPLEAILDPSIAKHEPLVEIGSEDWPYESEVYNTSDSVVQMLGNTSYRMHRFRTSASPVKGLTADILIKVAEIAYAKPTIYERYAPNQLQGIVDVVKAIQDHEETLATA